MAEAEHRFGPTHRPGNYSKKINNKGPTAAESFVFDTQIYRKTCAFSPCSLSPLSPLRQQTQSSFKPLFLFNRQNRDCFVQLLWSSDLEHCFFHLFCPSSYSNLRSSLVSIAKWFSDMPHRDEGLGKRKYLREFASFDEIISYVAEPAVCIRTALQFVFNG